MRLFRHQPFNEIRGLVGQLFADGRQNFAPQFFPAGKSVRPFHLHPRADGRDKKGVRHGRIFVGRRTPEGPHPRGGLDRGHGFKKSGGVQAAGRGEDFRLDPFFEFRGELSVVEEGFEVAEHRAGARVKTEFSNLFDGARRGNHGFSAGQ